MMVLNSPGASFWLFNACFVAQANACSIKPLKNDLLTQAVDSAHTTIDENQAVPQNVTSGNFSLASSRLLPLPSSCQ
jgi:hypothetical protein